MYDPNTTTIAILFTVFTSQLPLEWHTLSFSKNICCGGNNNQRVLRIISLLSKIHAVFTKVIPFTPCVNFIVHWSNISRSAVPLFLYSLCCRRHFSELRLLTEWLEFGESLDEDEAFELLELLKLLVSELLPSPPPPPPLLLGTCSSISVLLSGTSVVARKYPPSGVTPPYKCFYVQPTISLNSQFFINQDDFSLDLEL
ncbi:hypothetical protein BDQ17DRAFT_1337013 [Cyathus striatus]|nr:hypothetical protein BDQ17DRAFT_1337013 [Cyathus striatus]